MIKKAVNSYISVWKGIIDFRGRTSRADYWYFVFVNVIIAIILMVLSSSSRLFSVLYYAYTYAMCVPSLAAGIRRLHDIGKRWYFWLIPFYNIYLLCLKGEPYANQFGQPPVSVSNVNETAADISNIAGFVCPYCGNRLTGTEAFCNKCGKPTHRK